MTISANIAYSVAVVVVWLTLLCCCGLGCNDSSSGNNINAGNNTTAWHFTTEVRSPVMSALQFFFYSCGL
jgi:hypothetical protein